MTSDLFHLASRYYLLMIQGSFTHRSCFCSQHHHGTGEFAAQSGACTVAQQSFQVLQRQISLQAEFVSHPNLTRSWKIVL